MLQAGHGQQEETKRRLGAVLVACHVQQLAQQLRPLARPPMRDRHADDVLPLRVMRVADQQAHIPRLHRRLRAQIVLEGAVDEVHRAHGGLAQEPTPQEQMAQDGRGVAQRLGGGDRGEGLLDEVLRAVAVQLGLAVADQVVGEPLEELELGLLVELDVARRVDVALGVAPGQQHRQRRVVQRLAARWQIAAPGAVQGADQPAHQRVRGEAAEILLGADGGVQGRLVRAQRRPLLLRTAGLAGRLVPAVDERGHVLAAHRGQRELGEALSPQPVVGHGRGAGGDHPQVVRIGDEEVGQPGPGALAVALGDLVDAVDQQQPAPGGQDAVGPAGRLGAVQRVVDRGQERGRGGQRLPAGDRAQGEHEGDAADQLLQAAQ
ncbi:hypothetical protein SANTM175S_06396 [Streptomyces antimycoticus]